MKEQSPPVFKKAICRGSYVFGSACGHCERCEWERPKMEVKDQPKGLNPGIAKTVKWLNKLGYKTTDSGDGKTHDYECDLDMPYVHIVIDDAENMFFHARKLRDELKKIGIISISMNEKGTSPNIITQFDPSQEFATISLFNIQL